MSEAATVGVSEACAMPDAAAEIMREAAHTMSEAVAEIAMRARIRGISVIIGLVGVTRHGATIVGIVYLTRRTAVVVGIRLRCSWLGSAQRGRGQSDAAHQHDRFE